MKEFVLSLSLAKSIENTISINIINFDNFFMIISFYLFYFLTKKLTGGDGAQRNPRPVERLVMP